MSSKTTFAEINLLMISYISIRSHKTHFAAGKWQAGWRSKTRSVSPARAPTSLTGHNLSAWTSTWMSACVFQKRNGACCPAPRPHSNAIENESISRLVGRQKMAEGVGSRTPPCKSGKFRGGRRSPREAYCLPLCLSLVTNYHPLLWVDVLTYIDNHITNVTLPIWWVQN